MDKKDKVRCKFVCVNKDIICDGYSTGHKIGMLPVTHGSEENERFFHYTPYGGLVFGTINDEAAKQFEIGKEYYIDISQA